MRRIDLSLFAIVFLLTAECQSATESTDLDQISDLLIANARTYCNNVAAINDAPTVEALMSFKISLPELAEKILKVGGDFSIKYAQKLHVLSEIANDAPERENCIDQVYKLYSLIVMPSMQVKCSNSKQIHITNKYDDKRLKRQFPAIYAGKPTDDDIVSRLIEQGYYYAPHRGPRSFTFDASNLGLPNGANLEAFSAHCGAVNCAKFHIQSYKANEKKGELILQSQYNGHIEPVMLAYDYTLPSGSCPK